MAVIFNTSTPEWCYIQISQYSMNRGLEYSSDDEDFSSCIGLEHLAKRSADEAEQESLRLLFFLAENSTSNSSFVHHGVSCNSCKLSPIRGIRYHCTECPDIDICNMCEVNKRHSKFHTLVKISIPIPLSMTPRLYTPSSIPSDMNLLLVNHPRRHYQTAFSRTYG